MKCSFYKNVWDKDGVVVPVEKVFDAIKNGKYKIIIEKLRKEKDEKIRQKIKKSLPGASFSGVFSKRFDKDITRYNGIVQIDIDNPKATPVIKKGLVSDKHVLAYFVSPSGGMKAFYLVDKDVKYHKYYSFETIKDYFESRYGVEVDPKCKNLSRLCFVSYDPELYFNPAPEIMDVKIKVKISKHHEYSGIEVADAKAIFNIAYGWLVKSGNFYVPGNRNNAVHDLACILNRAGLDESDAQAICISQLGVEQEMIEEVNDTISNTYKRNRNEFGSNPIKINVKKRRNSLF